MLNASRHGMIGKPGRLQPQRTQSLHLTPYTLQAMPRETSDPRSTLIELAKEGRFSWELIAQEFIMANSSDDMQDVLDTLIDNY